MIVVVMVVPMVIAAIDCKDTVVTLIVTSSPISALMVTIVVPIISDKCPDGKKNSWIYIVKSIGSIAKSLYC